MGCGKVELSLFSSLVISIITCKFIFRIKVFFQLIVEPLMGCGKVELSLFSSLVISIITCKFIFRIKVFFQLIVEPYPYWEEMFL